MHTHDEQGATRWTDRQHMLASSRPWKTERVLLAGLGRHRCRSVPSADRGPPWLTATASCPQHVRGPVS